MKTIHPSLIAALILGAALTNPAKAQPPGPPPPPPGNPERPPVLLPPILFFALDADKDGVISASEITDASTSLLTLDRDKDGELSFQEITPPPAPPVPKEPSASERRKQESAARKQARKYSSEDPGTPPPPPVDPLLAALDTDVHVMLSADEIANATTSLLTLDANDDGKLTAEEVCPRPPVEDPEPTPEPTPTPAE